MTPDQLSKSGSERSHQVALFAWAAVACQDGFRAANEWLSMGDYVRDPENGVAALKWLHAIPNGGSRGDTQKSRMIRGGQLKAEGVRPGVADIFWPYPCGKFAGLYIELKNPGEKPVRTTSKGGMSDEQIKFANYAQSVGYAFRVAYSWREAANDIELYFTSGECK